MKIKFFIIMLLATSNVYAKNISILFIGNSYTKMNDFSKMVSDIGAELGDTIYADFSAFDSYTLEKHFSNQETIDKINSNNWDYVVLQEQSQLPAKDINTFNEKTYYYANKILQIIYNNNPDTHILLFMTWGRRYGDKDLCKKYPYTCEYEGMQNMLIDRYNLLGEMLGVDVVPCGIAWKYFTLDSNNHINLFYEDNSHPNEIGSYLNALCFYSAITGNSAIGTTCPIQNITDNDISTYTGFFKSFLIGIQNITDAEVLELQKIAAEISIKK